MSRYKVLIDDNYHFMDESERVTHGVFDTADEAIAACKQIVDECLVLGPGMTARALYEQYMGFGDDPFIMPVGPSNARGLLSLAVCRGAVRGHYCRIATG